MSVSEYQGLGEYNSTDNIIAVPHVPAPRETPLSTDWVLSHKDPSIDIGSVTPECSPTDTGRPELLDVNILFSQLKAGGCEDASTQLEWPSVRHEPIPREEISQIFVPSDIYHGKLKNRQQLARLLCFKTSVLSDDNVSDKLKNVVHKISTWSKSKHPNILGLIGVTTHQDQIAMVAPWTDYLDLQGFLLAHPQVDRYALTTRIAYGVAYLHGKNIVHEFIMGVSSRSCLWCLVVHIDDIH
ncbi:hypothetical protein B0J17DRAFT_306177 [Rhizoctonia solani]|nr:hypothetical protein B0J17DRAFT_306177 [Rhizoctonia solani]